MFYNTRRVLSTFRFILAKSRNDTLHRNDLLAGHGVENLNNIRMTILTCIVLSTFWLLDFIGSCSIDALFCFVLVYLFTMWYITRVPDERLNEELEYRFGKNQKNKYKSLFAGRILITPRGISLSMGKRTPENIVSRRHLLQAKLAEAASLTDAAATATATAVASADASASASAAATAAAGAAAGAAAPVQAAAPVATQAEAGRTHKIVAAMLSDRPCSVDEDYVIGKALRQAQSLYAPRCAARNSGYMSTIDTPLLTGVRLYPGIPMTDACCCQLISSIADYLSHGGEDGRHGYSGAHGALVGAGKVVRRSVDGTLDLLAKVVGDKDDRYHGDYADDDSVLLRVHDRNNHSVSNQQWVPPIGRAMQKVVKPNEVTFWGFGFIWGAEHTRRLHDLQAVGLRRAAYGSNGSPDIHAIGGTYKAYEPIYLPESNLKGHTLLLGTTGAGKTRFFDLEISQAIARGDTVIVIDPKGDRQLQRSIVRAAKDSGRDPMHNLFILDLSRKQFIPNGDEHSLECYDRCRGIIKPFGDEGGDDTSDMYTAWAKDGKGISVDHEINAIWDGAKGVDHEMMTAPCDSLITKDMHARAAYACADSAGAPANAGRTAAAHAAAAAAAGSAKGALGVAGAFGPLGSCGGEAADLAMARSVLEGIGQSAVKEVKAARDAARMAGIQADIGAGENGRLMGGYGPDGRYFVEGEYAEDEAALRSSMQRGQIKDGMGSGNDAGDMFSQDAALHIAIADPSKGVATQLGDMGMGYERSRDFVAPAASAFAGSSGKWSGTELDEDDVIINCSNIGINPVGAFDQPAQIGARLTSMLSDAGASASFKNYSNMAVTAAVVCCQLTGKRITVENIRDLVTDPTALQVAIRSYINSKVEEIDNDVVNHLWNTIHGVGGPLNGISGVVTASLGPQATGEAPVGNYHEVIRGLIEAGKIKKSAFKTVLEQMKHSPVRPKKDDLLTLFGNIADLDPVLDAEQINAMCLSNFDREDDRKAAEAASAADITGLDLDELDSSDAATAASATATAEADASASASAAAPAANAASSGRRRTTTRRTANKNKAEADAMSIDPLFAGTDFAELGIDSDAGSATEADADASAAPAKRRRSTKAAAGTATTRKTSTKSAAATKSGAAKSTTTRKTAAKAKSPTLAASKKRVMCGQAENEVLQAFYDWLCKSGLCKDLIDCKIVFMVTGLPVEYYRKVTNSVVPYLGSLTGGVLKGLISGDKNEAALPDLRDLIEGNKIFLADIHCLKDATTGQTLGKMLLSDLAFVAGDINATGMKLPRISVFIDEASELADEALVQLLNKSRSAGFNITIATQSFADLSRRSGSKDAAHQIVANCNNLISMRVNDPETAAIVSSVLPRTSVGQRSSSIQYSSDPSASQVGMGQGLMMQDASLFPPDALMMLPDFEYVARFSDGSFYKGFIPRMAPDEEVYPDAAKQRAMTMASAHAAANAAANGGASAAASATMGGMGGAANGVAVGGVEPMGVPSIGSLLAQSHAFGYGGGPQCTMKDAVASSTEVPACFRQEFSDADLRGNVEGMTMVNSHGSWQAKADSTPAQDPGLVGLHQSEHHLEDLVKETQQSSYAVYRNPDGYVIGSSRGLWHGLESPVGYFKERVPSQVFSQGSDLKTRLAVIAALPLLLLKYLGGTALILSIYLWQWLRRHILSSAIVELLLICALACYLAYLACEPILFARICRELNHTLMQYFSIWSEDMTYCIRHHTFYRIRYIQNLLDAMFGVTDVLAWYLSYEGITLTLFIVGLMYGSRSKIVSAIHHTTPPGSGFLISLFGMFRRHPFITFIVFVIIGSTLFTSGFIFGGEVAYLTMGYIIASFGYCFGCAITRHAK